jgi:hypothetical protein
MAAPENLIVERFDGGLVTARDPAKLEPGELVVSNNVVYQPDDTAIYKAKGRTKYNSSALGAGGNVNGVRYLEFDDGSALLAAHESDDIHLSQFSAETGTFGTLTAISNVGQGQSMDSAHYGNRHFLFTGAGQNTVVKLDGTYRKHGMDPVPDLITTPTTTSGAWNQALGTGFYHFLYTEVIKDTVTGIEIESAFSGKPKSVNVTTLASQSVVVTKNGITYNTGATHWRVYMAGPTVFETPVPLLSDFHLVGELDIASTTITVGNQIASGARLATVSTVITGGWSNVNNVFSDTDGVGMRSSTLNSAEFLRTFTFSGLTGTITGFEVFIRFRIPDWTPFYLVRNSPILIVDLSHNGTNFFPGNNSRYFICRMIQGAVGGYVTVVLGNPYDPWGRTGSPAWALGDVNGNASFGVKIKYGEEYGGPDAIVDVDWVKVAVHTTGSARPVDLSGRIYQTVAVSVAGLTTVFSADMPPPVSTTGDIFEGQLIVNDTGDPSIIRGSLPDEVESFPEVYFVNFETKDRDEVTCVRRLGNKFVVGLSHQVYRLNYFPRETDAEFDRGRCYEAISEHHGIVGPMAATLFSPDGGSILLAFVSHDGVRVTDGFQTRAVSGDVDWAGTVRLPSAADVTNYLRGTVLVNYPKSQQIWMYYVPTGATTRTKALVFHYGSHMKNGAMKATGPIDVAAFSACLSRLGGDDVVVTGQSGGFVYVEDRGYNHNAGGTIPVSIKTREMYHAGYAGNVTLESTRVRLRSDSPTGTVTIQPITRSGGNAQVSQTAKTFTNATGGVALNSWRHNFDSLQLSLTEPGVDGGGALRLTEMVLEVYGHGLPESRG